MMLSNYPPGVSGHEPQIVGHEEITLSVTCGETIDTVLSAAALALVTAAHRAVHAANAEADTMIGAVRRLRDGMRDLSTITTTCPFDGEVVAEQDGYVARWTCPLCDAEHEVEL